MNYYSIITNNGLINHANASNNSLNLNLTEMAVGDSNGIYYDPSGTETSLVNETYRVNLSHIVIDENNPNQLIVEAVLEETVGPFYIREVGIFDADGNLFAIGKYPETFKPNLPSGSGKRLYIRMILGFSSTPNVNLVINNDVALDPNFNKKINDQFSNLTQKVNQINSVPVGSIIALPTKNLVDGYLECNGASINKTTYSNLFNVIGTNFGTNDEDSFNLPDLRGEFIRGYDNNRGVDQDRIFGSYQTDLFKSHNHSYSALSRWGANAGGQAPYWCRGDSGGGTAIGQMTYNGGNETRPRNIALKYIIKF